MAKRRPKAGLEGEIDELYSLPLEEFTANRDALAKRLRGDGERADADRVRKLRKPPRSAWLLNQGVRAEPAAAKRLLETGERLSQAQDAALSGEGSNDLKRAMADQQAAIETMMEAIDQLEVSERPSPAIVDRARETLRAVAGDEELQGELAAGRITRDREAVGFGGAAPAAAPRRGKRPQRRDPSVAARRRDAERGVRRATRSLEAAEKRAREARKRLERAQAALDAASAAHGEADRERAEREAELETARGVLEDLE
jgi:hypothetical protein